MLVYYKVDSLSNLYIWKIALLVLDNNHSLTVCCLMSDFTWWWNEVVQNKFYMYIVLMF